MQLSTALGYCGIPKLRWFMLKSCSGQTFGEFQGEACDLAGLDGMTPIQAN
jgi:hypothetical protein